MSRTTSVSTAGGVVIISGDNFGQTADGIVVSVNGAPCSDVQVVTNDTVVQCTAISGTGKNHPVNINVGGQIDEEDIFTYRGKYNV